VEQSRARGTRLQSIRQYLLLRVVALVLLVVFGFLGVSYLLVLRPAQDELAGLAMSRAAEAVETDVTALVAHIERVLSTCREWGKSELFGLETPREFAKLLVPIIDVRPQISAILIADTRGRSLQLNRIREGGWLIRETDVARLGTRQRHITLSKSGAYVGEKLVEAAGFDPRTRPWYAGALALRSEDDVHWTAPYRFFNRDDIGMSASMRWTGRADGRPLIIMFDVLLVDLSKFSSKAAVGEHGRAAILTQDGKIIGMPRDLAARSTQELEKVLFKTPRESGFPILAEAHDRWLADGRRESLANPFNYEGQAWISRFAPLAVRDQRLLVASYAPRADFQIGTRRDAIALGAVLVVAMLLAFLLARRFSMRLGAIADQLAQSSERIGGMRLDEPVRIDTQVSELARLVGAQEKMRVLLLEGTRGLEAKVAARTAELAEREHALTEALERQNAIFSASPYGIAVFQERQCVLASPSFERIFGYQAGEFVGRSSRELFESLEDFQRIGTEMYPLIARGETYDYELRLLRKGGESFWCRVIAARLAGEGTATRIVALYQDITTRKAAEDALRAAHAELDAIFEAATVGVVLVRSRRIERCNARAEELYGFGRGELAGMPARGLLFRADEDYEALSASTRAQLSSGATVHREKLIARRDGSEFWCRFSGRAINPADVDGGTVWMLEDVSEEHAVAEALKEAKRVAEEATRAKSMFLASMSHEIRTPMNGVLGMLQLLALSRLDGEQKATLDTVRDSARSLLRVIDDVLDFSKIEAGRLELRPEATSIAALVESVRHIYSGVASAKDLTLGASVDPRISPALFTDPLRLRQILNNFASNAIKFTAKGRVEIAAVLQERADGREVVRFHVTDTGVGVSKEAQAQLFQPYVQAAIDTARRYGGTGLGLTICRRLAEMMRGTIEMASEPGRGTTMTLVLSLPIADPRDLPKPDTSDASAAVLVASRRRAPGVEAARAEGTLVLIAEDHPTNRKLLARLLGLLGYATVAAEDGREALQKWQAGGIAAIVTDCNMPEMDGYELARAIRAKESAKKRTPIIACTANALADELERCAAAGMDDFVAKPVELERLAKVMEQWLPLPSGAGETPPVNAANLAEVSGGDAAMEREILADFRTANQADMAKLRDALGRRDMKGIAQTAHRVNGACRTIGAAALAEVCERVEGAAKRAAWQAVATEQRALELEFERLEAWLAAQASKPREGMRT